MLLFTDGLVERRGEALDEGLARLAADAVRSTVRPLELWCEDVVAAQLRGREVDDDVAVLAVELLAAPAAGAGNARHPKVDA
jgi:hypothetical protein